MKYATFSLPTDPTQRIGVIDGERVLDLKALASAQGLDSFPASLLELIQRGPNVWRQVGEIVAGARGAKTSAKSFLLSEVRLHAPIPRPLKNVMCLGLNYLKHLQETAR